VCARLKKLGAIKLRRLNSKSGLAFAHPGLANEVMEGIFHRDKIFRKSLKGRKKRIYADDLNIDEGVTLALAILEKYPDRKDHYI
jgi:hypothetical protein